MPDRAAADGLDYDGLMRAHLGRVFNERDVVRRDAALDELYAEDVTLFDPDAVVRGRRAVSAAVGALQASLPAGFVFTAAGPAIGHHGVARLCWQAGPKDGPAAVTGTDVARIEAGRIRTLHVFVDPASASRPAEPPTPVDVAGFSE